ncbi:MAG: hypothetical protein IKC81_00935 [Paludibacteraceae bacterium]|nr:hypothetical protein [Paludibacteraceae bacterium]
MFILCWMAVVVPVFAAGTLSPYSRYGYGEWCSAAFSASKSMGGLGYGLRNNTSINMLNPASYTAVDSLTFMLDLGVSGKIDGFKTKSDNSTLFNGNVDYVAIQLPLAKFAAISFGVSPLTTVGYNYSFTDVKNPYTDKDTLTVKQSFNGNGGMTQVYLGLSFDILDRVAVGVNGHYVFGNISHFRQVSFPYESSMYKSTTQTENLYVSAWLCDVGVQYHQPIGNSELVVGAAYSLQLPMHNRTVTTTQTTLIEEVVDTESAFDYPQIIGAGVSYKWENRLLVGVDVAWQNFAAANYYGKTQQLNDRFVYAIGAQYVHKPGSKSYVENMEFRIGANYANSYIDIDNKGFDKWAITWGIGFPLPNTMTKLNLHMEYGQQGSIQTNGLLERYYEIGIGVSLNERWFVKRKLK